MIEILSKFVIDNIGKVLVGIAGLAGFIAVYVFGRKDGKAIERNLRLDSAIAAYRRKDDENAKDVKKTNEVKELADEIIHDPDSGFH